MSNIDNKEPRIRIEFGEYKLDVTFHEQSHLEEFICQLAAGITTKNLGGLAKLLDEVGVECEKRFQEV